MSRRTSLSRQSVLASVQIMGKVARKSLPIPTYVQQPHVLTMFDDIPPYHKIVIVRQGGFEPFLRLGDYAVVDTSDKALSRQDALYMTWGDSPRDGRFLRVVEACIDSYRDGKGGFYDAAHWRYALQRPDFLPMGDGPYGLEGWPALCFGRVVGIYEPMSTQIRIDASGLPASVLHR